MSEATVKHSISGRARSPASATDLPQTIRWMGVVVRVPTDWQVVRHGLNPFKGSLQFMDRREQRMQLTWTRCRTRPELDRLLSDYQAAQVQRDPDARFTDFDAPDGWRAKLRRLDVARALVRAVRYDDSIDELIEVVLSVTDDHAGHALARELLASIEIAAAADRARRWQAFSLDVTAPDGWRISHTHARPADAMLAFEQQHSRRGRQPRSTGKTCEIRRMALARHWFDEPEPWLRRQLNKTPFELESAPRGAHDGWIARSVIEPSLWARLGQRTRRRLDRLWHCPAADAVYHLKMLARPKDTLEPEAFRVQCCPEGVAMDEHDDG